MGAFMCMNESKFIGVNDCMGLSRCMGADGCMDEGGCKGATIFIYAKYSSLKFDYTDEK